MAKSTNTVSRIKIVSQFLGTALGSVWNFVSEYHLLRFMTALILCMFALGYFESLRWPLPPPKATHGILKGFFLVVAGVMVIFRHNIHWRMKTTEELVVVSVFLLSFIISSVFSLAPETSLLFLWYPFIGTMYIYVFRCLPMSKKTISIIIGIAAMLIMVTFMFAIFSIFSRYEVDSVYYFIFLDHRANYFLEEIRKAGKYVSLGPYIMLMPLTAVFLIQKHATLVRKLISVLVICVSVLTAVISNNRIDVLVLAIQLGVILWFIPRRLAVILLLAAIPITQLGLSITEQYFGFNLEERILRPHYERDTETIVMRETYWQTAFINFRQYPLFGTGPNSYNDVSDFPERRYYDGSGEYTVRSDNGIGVHNLFIERLSDTGLFGFIAFVAMLLFYLKADILAFFSRKNRESRIQYVLFALSSWSWILYGITDNGYGAQGFVTFFFLRGVMNHL